MNKKLFKAVPALALGCILMNATTPVLAQTTSSSSSQAIEKEIAWLTWSEAAGTAVAGGVGGAAGGAAAGALAGGVGAAPGALAGGVGGAVAGGIGNVVYQGWNHYFGSVASNATSFDYSTALD